MEVVHRTGKTEKRKLKRVMIKEVEKAELKAQKRKRRDRRFLLTFIAVLLTGLAFFAGLPWYISIAPIVMHLALAFYVFALEFYQKRNEERAWRAYVKKYGDKNGNIPPHVQMTHRKLAEQGKSIAV